MAVLAHIPPTMQVSFVSEAYHLLFDFLMKAVLSGILTAVLISISLMFYNIELFKCIYCHWYFREASQLLIGSFVGEVPNFLKSLYALDISPLSNE